MPWRPEDSDVVISKDDKWHWHVDWVLPEKSLSDMFDVALAEWWRLEEVTPNDTAYNGMTFSEEANEVWYTYTYYFDSKNSMRKNKLKQDAIWKLRERSAKNDAGYEPDWRNSDNHNQYIKYNYDKRMRQVDNYRVNHHSNFSLPYFSSKEKAQQCIEDCKDFLDDLLD